jgi:Dolichyl-phosphate-mannose-protein mannosyltransferase
MITFKQGLKYSILFPIILASVIHLWNPGGFPSLHPDEGDYLRKTMHVLSGLGPQEGGGERSAINQTYTHPHFGQLFLATILGILGYPQMVNAVPDVHSIEVLYAVPRLIMGLLAVIDTFVIYKIAERRFDRTVALVASCLFAVMPATLILRQVYLDNILLPFLLSSIFFALYINPTKFTNQGTRQRIKNDLLILFSGALLGIAIYTKIPAFTMIPLVGYLVFMNSGKRIKTMALWFIPVIAIPCLWPAYALHVGEFDLWISGIAAQGNRLIEQGQNKLLYSFGTVFKIDPLLIMLGTAGLAFAALKKEYWILVWVIPFLVFSYFIEWVIYFHLALIFPAFCLSGALLIVHLFKFNIWRRIVSPVLISTILFFGAVASTLLISYNVNSFQYEGHALIVNQLTKNHSSKHDDKINYSDIVLVGHRIYYWIPKYIFRIGFQTFPTDSLPAQWNNSKVILVDNGNSCCCQCPYFGELYDGTKKIQSFKRPSTPEYYPFTGIVINPSIGKKVSVRTS